MTEDLPRDSRLDELVEAFVARLRAGEQPSIDEVARDNPDLAADIHRIFPTLQTLESLLAAPASPSEGSPPAPGRSIGGYRLLDQLGRGGMGVVFEAEPVAGDGDPAARVALKLIHAHLGGRPTIKERFLREVELGRSVDHPAVVRTLAAGVHEAAGHATPYLVMDRVHGTTLRQLASSMGGRLPEPLLRHIAIQVATGLEAIHESGIVHRDLKPTNVMVTRDHRVCIMDLGVARLIDDPDTLSGSELFVGSMRYASPEQFDRAVADIGPATDLYSLGVMLFEMATGRHPFGEEGMRSLVSGHLTRAPPRVIDLEPGISPLVTELTAALLEKDPTARPASAAIVRQALVDESSSSWWRERQRLRAGAASRITTPPLPRGTALVGRRDSLALLREAYAAACDRRGRVLLLQGDAGMGKTRLIAELARERR